MSEVGLYTVYTIIYNKSDKYDWEYPVRGGGGGLRGEVGLKLNIQKTKIMASGPISSWQIDGETVETVTWFILGRLQKSLQMVTAAMKLKDTCFLEEKLWETYMQVKKQQLEPDMEQQTGSK